MSTPQHKFLVAPLVSPDATLTQDEPRTRNSIEVVPVLWKCRIKLHYFVLSVLSYVDV